MSEPEDECHLGGECPCAHHYGMHGSDLDDARRERDASNARDLERTQALVNMRARAEKAEQALALAESVRDALRAQLDAYEPDSITAAKELERLRAINAALGCDRNEAVADAKRLRAERDAALRESPSFAGEWAKKEAEGYRYGEDALEGVRFGFRIAVEALDRTREPLLARFTLAVLDQLWPALEKLSAILPDEENYSDEDVNLAARAVSCIYADLRADFLGGDK